MKAFESGFIGNLKVKNRIVMAPMISNLANEDGSSNDNLVRYLEERAKGGVGLILTEYTYIDEINSRGSRNELGAYSYSLVPKLSRITDAIHPYEARVFMQLVHAGGKALRHENAEEPMAPSSLDYLGTRPREMTAQDIEGVISSFEKAARVAKASKFDGIEVHGAHGYLMHQFLSPTLNIRKDRYGGTFENRLSVPQAVIDAIKSATGLPVGIRLSLYEDDPGGWDEDYGLKVAESLKNIDYVHFSAGNFNPPGSSASFYSPETHILRRLKKKPGLATILVGSVLNREGVERVLAVCDFVAIGRALLADPFFAYKIEKSPSLLRPCIRCNQACRHLSLGEVRCTVNADVGFEGRGWGKMKGELVIKGAGVQGLEAALYASKLGLEVSIYEKEESIGGQLNRISDPFKRAAFLPLINFYEKAIEHNGINLETGSAYQGEGIDCFPPVVYPEPPDTAETFLSNVYSSQDAFLKIAESKKIRVGKKSLNSLDRGRRVGYVSIAEKKGIEFIDDGDFEFELMVDDQYDIEKAMELGRGKIKKFLAVRENEFL